MCGCGGKARPAVVGGGVARRRRSRWEDGACAVALTLVRRLSNTDLVSLQ